MRRPLATLRGQLLRDRERWVREELAQRRIAFDDFGIQDRDVPTVRVVETSTASPEDVLTAARDFSPRRAELWRDVYLEHLTVHDRGKTWADVTEGNPWPIGLVWERLRYDWSEPGSLKGNVVESNIFKAGSTWEVRATRAEDGGSRVEIIGVRHLRGRGWLLWPFFPLGLARRDVADYLRKFLAKVEATDQQWRDREWRLREGLVQVVEASSW